MSFESFRCVKVLGDFDKDDICKTCWLNGGAVLAKEDALMHCHGPSFTHFLHLLRLSEGRTKKSPRSSMLNKMNTNHTNLSRKSKLGASLAFRPVLFGANANLYGQLLQSLQYIVIFKQSCPIFLQYA